MMSKSESIDLKLLEQSCHLRVIKAVSLPFVTHRQLHHWKTLGLIDEHRGLASSGAHNRFSFFDAVWIQCIVLMRELGIDNKHILSAKASLYQKQAHILTDLTSLEKAIIDALAAQKQNVVLVFREKQAVVLDQKAYMGFVQKGGDSGYFCLQLYPILGKLIVLLKDQKEFALIHQQWTTNTADKH